MSIELFKKKCHIKTDLIRSTATEDNPLLSVIMPILNMVLKALDKKADEDPAELRSWLMIFRSHLDEVIESYDVEDST